MYSILYILLLPILISAQKYSEQERVYRLPQLLYLDDYNRCLVQRNGLYCMGTFELTPIKYPHSTYDYMKKYSSDSASHFNRTRIHRGYCVSTRCPTHIDNASLSSQLNATLQLQRNASERFEHCVAEWAQKFSLRSSLHTFQYCHTHTDVVKTHVPDTPELIFLFVIIAILLLNIIGTVYDCCKKDDSSKSKLLSTWSIPANWNRLVNTKLGEDSRLNDLLPTHGFKALTMFLVLTAHIHGTQAIFLTYEPHKLEDVRKIRFGLLLKNGASLIKAMATLACFLTSYNLLLLSDKVKLSVKLLPLCLLKRINRLAPIFLLVTGFGATWWVHVGAGPLWSSTVTNNRNVCRRQFWSHVFFVNNLVKSENMCIPSSWSLVSDVQLSIVCCFLTLTLARLRRRALFILAALALAACVFNAILAYAFELVPFREFVHLENIRTFFRDVPSFNFYVNPLSTLPCSLMGVFLAHLHYELQREKFNAADHKWLVIGTIAIIPITITTVIATNTERKLSRLTSALLVGFEQPIISAASMFILYGVITIEGPLREFFTWPGFQIPSRLTLPLATINWWVAITVAASKPQPILSSKIDTLVDVIATYILSILISIPLTVLVETPMRRFLDTLIFSSYLDASTKKTSKELQDIGQVGLNKEESSKKVL